jgi:DHA1 family tetracycline resistance protein-like MFS transporter
MTFIAAPILGEFSDLYGRKKLLTICIGILAVSQIIFGVGIEMSSLVTLFIARAIAGLAGANISIAQASIADISEPHNRAKNFGLIGAAVGLGFILGPVIGGFIVSLTHNASLPFFAASFLGIINLISVTFFLPETRKISADKTHSITIFKAIHNIKGAFADKEASPLYTSSFFYLIGFTFFTSFTGIYLVERFGISAGNLGTYFGVIGVWIVITQTVILRVLTKIYNEKQILKISLVLVAFTIFLMPFMPSMIYVYALIPFIAIPQGLSMANMGALISKSVSKEKQGAALGINGSLSALAQGVVPALAGGATALFGITVPYFISACMIILAWRNLFFRSVK